MMWIALGATVSYFLCNGTNRIFILFWLIHGNTQLCLFRYSYISAIHIYFKAITIACEYHVWAHELLSLKVDGCV
ncbi:hypothetical protein COMA2_70047 [Candidatus Nitrospira nitrificans]|uniref:Uncharacterized protein n=1 Tax=Candidatus Nitrospira nitrificans TaxID=1742973 RepID=A0A0S4LNZ8_9BACT|nr:hypothetical protein COMA2_70047 [Candidatus Nitrospira nitrificans]